jgi:hypothetical protein
MTAMGNTVRTDKRIRSLIGKAAAGLQALVLCCALLVTAGCDISGSDGTGALTISFAAPASRSVNWSPDLDTDSYRVTLEKSGYTRVAEFQKGPGSTLTVDAVTAGTWTVDVQGFNSSGEWISELEAGPIQAVVRRSEVTPVSASLIPRSGTGTLQVTCTVSSSLFPELTAPYLKLELYSADAPDTLYRTETYLLVNSGGSITVSLEDLPAGYYEAVAAVHEDTGPDADPLAARSVFFSHVAEGLTTEGTLEVSFAASQQGDSTDYITIGDQYYAVHSFLYDQDYDTGSGQREHSFSVRGGLEAEYLLVAGGGGGGSYGGGGAGGLLTNVGGEPLYLPGGSYSILVGRGGSGTSENLSGSNGADSAAFGLTAVGGGGGGGGMEDPDPGSGGSGGGGGVTGDVGVGTSGVMFGGSGIAGQGNSGGYGYYNSDPDYNYYSGGGGGGVGSAGGNAYFGGTLPPSIGNGGYGASNTITGEEVFYAGGGGGGMLRDIYHYGTWYSIDFGDGGIGGGGDGGAGLAGRQINGEPHTGGGGGASRNGLGQTELTSGDGGSGIVIVRYRTQIVIRQAEQ